MSQIVADRERTLQMGTDRVREEFANVVACHRTLFQLEVYVHSSFALTGGEGEEDYEAMLTTVPKYEPVCLAPSRGGSGMAVSRKHLPE